MTKNVATTETKSGNTEANDPVLSMLGVGKHLWKRESGDEFVDRLRAEDIAPPVSAGEQESSAEHVHDLVWSRIEEHQAEEFKTATGLAFTYTVEGAGIWFFRNGRRINRKLSRSHVEKAIARCPLKSTTEIKDLMGYAYLFGVLMDARIRRQGW